MIIVTSAGITDDQLDALVSHIERAGLRTHVSRGEHRTIVGCIAVDISRLGAVKGCNKVVH